MVRACLAGRLLIAGAAVATLGACAATSTSLRAPSTPPVLSTGTSASSAATTTARPVPAPRTPPPPTRVSAVPADTSRTGHVPALDLLARVPVKGRAPMTGYSRTQFGQSWTDDNDDPLGHNGCDTRNDILRRDLSGRVLKADTRGCVVTSGTLVDPYTGRRIAFVRGVSTSTAVQIDHVVALGDAWQTGAQQLSAEARTDLANDPLELLAVDGPTNEAKGDGDAATWLPPNKAYRCAYVARQIAVKVRYRLWMTAAESTASARVLSSCPGEPAPAETPLAIGATTTAPRAAPARSSAPASTSARPHSAPPVHRGCTETSSGGSCIRGGEFCPQNSYSEIGYDADGTRYACEGDPDHPHWEIP